MTKNKQILWFLRGYYFFYFAMIGVYVVFMPKILTDLGYKPYEVGIIYASAPMMRFLIPFVFKHFLELTYKIFVASLMLCFFSIWLFYATIDGFYGYLISNIFFGGAMGISLPYIEAYSLSILPKASYGKTRLWGSLGFMAIVLVLGKILNSPNIGLFSLGLTAFLTLYFGISATLHNYKKKNEAKENSSGFSLLKYKYLWISLFLMQISFGGFYNFFTIYETSHGLSLELTSYLWSFGVMCEIVMLYFQGPLLHKNLLTIIKFATFATAIRWLMLYTYPASTLVAFASQSLHAFSFALYHTAVISYIFCLYAQKKLAQQFYLGISFGLGGSIGAISAGYFYGEYLFLIESILALVAFLSLFGIKEKNEQTI
ncbi:MAG: MFS transporter [Sulfurovaceae bacterium]|nr:MFS transporter [Sulfurovaceae bacterium]MDD5548123.1 MFS transporter [Sulfurovaceae bacterium]